MAEGMNIWQWIVVVLPFIRFGAALSNTYRSDRKLESKIGGGIGDLLWLCGSLFVLYKAGVLIID